MNDFAYHNPTKVLFGRGTEALAGREIARLGCARAFLVHMDFARRTGLIERVEAALGESGVAVRSRSGVQPNPRLQFVRDAAEEARAFGADFVLAVGGGSVIDTAKAVAHALANPGVDPWAFWHGRPLTASTPVGAILTIAASGSETSESAVLTDGETHIKKGFDSPFNRPQFAIMNPELAATLPPRRVAAGVVDIMMHTLDRYFTPTQGNDLTDAFAEALLRTAIQHGPAAVAHPSDYQAMSELMWCGSVSHTGLTGLGAAWDFSTHALGRELSAMFDAVHGESLSCVWGSWARYVLAANPRRFARYARNVWGVVEADDAAAAALGIESTEAFFRALGMPIGFKALGIGVQRDDALRALAYGCADQGTRTVGSLRRLDQQDLYRIYHAANF